MAGSFNAGFATIASVFLSHFFIFTQLCSSGNQTVACEEQERQALLKFKDSFNNYTLSYEHKVASWKGEDCCKWKGIGCDSITGHVVKIDLRTDCNWQFDISCLNDYSYHCLTAKAIAPSLMKLKHLNYLDLSGHNFLFSNIPPFLGSMKNLKYLNLSHSRFFGRIPPQLGNLTDLQILDLSGDFDLYCDNFRWISQLSSLQYIDMSGLPIWKTDGLMQVISKLPSLLKAHFMDCGIVSLNVSHDFTNSTFPGKVQVLNLKGNSLSGPLPIALRNMTSIKVLDLSENHLSYIPLWLAEFSNLVQLHLAGNHLSGPIPITLQNMSSVKFLDLSRNSLSSLPSYFGKLNKSLMHLILASNPFSSPIPESLGGLSKLRVLNISETRLNGMIPDSLGELLNLYTLDISNNHLKGIVPATFGKLYNLTILDLSNNSLEGIINEIHLGNLSNLQVLRIGFNNLALRLKPNWLPPFQLTTLEMHPCRINSSFPQWLHTQNHLLKLDLSNTSIWGTIPKWLWKTNLDELDLSNNKINGPILENLQGNMSQLLLGNNLINGSLSKSMCELKELRNLDISKNNLSSKIPDCLWQIGTLEFVDLSSNVLSGTIPNSFSSSCPLESLNLSNNNLHGELPTKLGNCVHLVILDLGYNQLSGSIPLWLGESFISLKILRLRGNMFNGTIPSSLCTLYILQILDLAHNKLRGSIPHCIENLEGMMSPHDQLIYMDNVKRDPLHFEFTNWDEEHVDQVIKGREFEYTKNLKFMFNIDLSSNKLDGCIPEGLTALSKLVNLNLSHNHLFGKIPSNIGKMNSLESVDFSNNTLSGVIPNGMSLLTSLSYLNLSHNNLSGPIPQKNQFSTFEDDPSRYVGNPYLCGIPLQNKCLGDETHQPPSSKGFEGKHGNEGAREAMLFYFVVAVGYVTGFWGAIGILVLKENWRHACFRYVEKVADNLYVPVAVRITSLKKAMKTEEKQ